MSILRCDGCSSVFQAHLPVWILAEKPTARYCSKCRGDHGPGDWTWMEPPDIAREIREAREEVSDAPDDTGAIRFSPAEDERANAYLKSHGWRDPHRDYPIKAE